MAAFSSNGEADEAQLNNSDSEQDSESSSLASVNSASEFPSTFRSVLEVSRGPGNASKRKKGLGSQAYLQLRCHCGTCTPEVVLEAGSSSRRCNCKPCQRFHTSAFATFVSVPIGTLTKLPEEDVKSFPDLCQHSGRVDRLMCRWCYSKLATVPAEGPEVGRVLVALGTVEDASIPVSLACLWQTDFEDVCVVDRAPWWDARPAPRRSDLQGKPRGQEVRGGCACGSCEFKGLLLPGEAQHCYCNLCRRLSGAVAMAWIPCSRDDFTWTRTKTLCLFRTTDYSSRHTCTHCGGVLTILYDSQPDCIWPVAGALSPESLPECAWYRVAHICCAWMPPWYQLPLDGLQRLKFAG